MIATIILGIFSVLFAYLAKYKNTRWGLKVSFTLIFLFLALRYNVGNDYETYLNAFIDISQYNQIDFFDNTQQFESGWMLLNWLFRSLGFFAMTAVLALFNCVVYYRFIKKYVPVRYYWLAIFLYIFYPEFMLIHSSAMRQSIAIMLFVFSLDYLYKKDAIRYFLCIGLASLFHFSALILLPVYLLGLFNWKIYKVYGVIFVSIFVSLFLFSESLSPYLKQFISNYFEKYAIYQDAGVVNTGLGFLYFSALFILILYFERLQNKEIALVFKIAIISFMLMPLTLIVELTARVRMYFAPATIIAYPIVLMNLKRPISKTIFLTLLLIFTAFQFFRFFYSDTWKDTFLTYQTIFSAPQWY
jgi:EpsG family